MSAQRLPLQKKFPWLLYWIALALIIVITVAPVGSVVACGIIANINECRVDEGSVHPCIINGKDYGHMLYVMGVMGWLMLVTLPAGVIAFAIWLVILIMHRNAWRRKDATTP
jgi:hypothetical protein